MKDVVRGVGALVALALLLVGAPAALVWLAGSPLPAGLPGLDDVGRALTEGRISESTVHKVLALVCWAAWSQLAVTVVVEATAAARGRVARRVRPLRLFQGAAAALVTAVLVSFASGRGGAPPERRPLTVAPPAPGVDPAADARRAEQTAEVEARHADDVLVRLKALTTDPLPPEGSADEPAPLRLPASWPVSAEMGLVPNSLVSTLAGAAVFAGGIVWSLNRRRRERERLREVGERPVPGAAADVQVEQAVRAAAGDGLSDLVHQALCALAAGAGAPPLAGVNVAEEVSLLFAAPAPVPFPGFTVEDGGFSWVATAASLKEAGVTGGTHPYNALVTVGHTAESEVLVNVATPGVLGVLGGSDDVTDTLFAMAVELATGPRAGGARVVAAGIDPALDGVEGLDWFPTLEDALPELETEAGCGTIVVCDGGEPPKSVVAIVGGHRNAPWRLELAADRVALQPLGVHLERHRIPASARRPLARLLGADDDARPVAQPRLFVVGSDEEHEPAVEVRILGAVDVRGVPEFRRRKALELVAYLALHRRGADADVLSEALWPGRLVSPATLHGMASAARRTLGLDLFPHAGPDGSYRLSDDVALDHDRFCASVADAETALAAGGPGAVRAARALLRRALTLVRGRPFTTPGGEYLWAHAEAIVSAVTADVADAAHLLATLYLDGDDPRGAWWATRQGLLASPGNEQLHRDRMLAADRSGNPAGVEDVMEELCRAIEVDRTEAHEFLHPLTVELYERLTRRGARLAASR